MLFGKIQKIVGISVLVISLSSCSMLPSIMIQRCEIPDVPTLPSTTVIDGERVVVLKRDDMADLLIFFDAVENCPIKI